jgi:hypothetical protein
MGTTLLQNTLTLFLHIQPRGGIALIEHPAPPIWHEDYPQLCSIWKLPQVNIIKECPTTLTHTFKQSIHGQIAPKPTTFLTCRIDKDIIRKFLYKRQRTCHKPTPTTDTFQIGISEHNTKQFNTAQLKEYPPSLNRAIALIINDQIQLHRANDKHTNQPTTLTTEQQEQILDTFKPYQLQFDDYMEQTREFGADYWHSAHRS